MRSGSNWCFLRGQLDSVVTRTLAGGQQVSTVHLRLPLGRPHEDAVMIVPVTTWNASFAQALQALPPGTVLSITGHLSVRHWRSPGGTERLAPEVILDHVATDIGVWLRAPDPGATDVTGKETS
jgi:single-stranded DNA-binding protein